MPFSRSTSSAAVLVGHHQLVAPTDRLQSLCHQLPARHPPWRKPRRPRIGAPRTPKPPVLGPPPRQPYPQDLVATRAGRHQRSSSRSRQIKTTENLLLQNNFRNIFLVRGGAAMQAPLVQSIKSASHLKTTRIGSLTDRTETVQAQTTHTKARAGRRVQNEDEGER